MSVWRPPKGTIYVAWEDTERGEAFVSDMWGHRLEPTRKMPVSGLFVAGREVDVPFGIVVAIGEGAEAAGVALGERVVLAKSYGKCIYMPVQDDHMKVQVVRVQEHGHTELHGIPARVLQDGSYQPTGRRVLLRLDTQRGRSSLVLAAGGQYAQHEQARGTEWAVVVDPGGLVADLRPGQSVVISEYSGTRWSDAGRGTLVSCDPRDVMAVEDEQPCEAAQWPEECVR